MRPAVSCARTALRCSHARYEPFKKSAAIVRQPLLGPTPHNAPLRSSNTTARCLHTAAASQEEVIQSTSSARPSNATLEKLSKLPAHCPGCGAPSQIVSTEDAGYYTLSRQSLRKHLRDEPVYAPDEEAATQPANISEASIICDRCHNLLHHAEGVPIFHPTIQSIHDILDESPHKHNHIYHILDAADLPMSLIPSLQNDLRLPRLRTQNRRSKHNMFTSGRSAEVSFIITRADLLAPNKEQVDTLMPYLRELLRDALGRERKNVRLGNLRCVSAKRGWWTTSVKEEIWKRGGGGWMVGKVNVGKSSLFEVVFPKGRGRQDTRSTTEAELDVPAPLDMRGTSALQPTEAEIDDDAEDSYLLPPARPEVAYPAMPIASALPGTTASPIRVPYGSGRGELIDLPGVARSTLEDFVDASARESLVMRSRVAAQQHVIKPGQSLLLGGGLIRITPSTPDQVVLAYPFLPLEAHVTSTAKALEIQAGMSRPGVRSVLAPDAHKSLRTAGNLGLKWDITRARAGPLTAKSAAKLKPSQLAFNVWGADLVVEGVGWVELVAQTRKAKEVKAVPSLADKDAFSEDNPFPEAMTDDQRMQLAGVQTDPWPKVEVFSPEGKHVMMRRPMNAWLLGGQKKSSVGKARPRRSMTSLKQSKRGRDMAAVAAS